VRRSRLHFGAARKLVSLIAISALPSSLMGQNSGAAMLHTNGVVQLNGNPAPVSSALLSDDTVQTQKTSTAKIDASGSTVDIQPETFIQFEGEEIFLDHGSLQVLTTRGLRVRVGCMTVIPVNADWTQYDVIDVEGKVTVASHKNDVKIESHAAQTRKARSNENGSDIVHATEQRTRDEKCGAALGEPAHATKGILDTLPAEIGGLAVVGGVACWVFCREPGPISPWKPK